MDQINNENNVISDVHKESCPTQNNNPSNQKLNLTKFEVIIPNELKYDSDGDLIKPIKKKILIEHCSETNVSNVGLQLWKGSLYLCDYLIHKSKDLLSNKIILDLGAGLGLTSIISSLFASKIYCTDLDFVLEQAIKNFKLNKTRLNLNENKIAFKSLDWFRFESSFDFTEVEFQEIQNTNVFLAADVIYDNRLTIVFLNSLFKLMKSSRNQPKIALISGEKRINFELESMKEDSSIYNLFETSLFELDNYEEDGIVFKVLKLEESFPQFLSDYKRNSHLFLWKIESNFK